MQTVRIIKVNALTMSSTGFCETFVPNSIFTQCVRWKRKPIWLPTAKSKMFRVPKKPVIPIEERVELLRLHNNYKTYMASFRTYLKQIAKENEIQFDKTIIEQTEEEDFKRCNAINDEWNVEVAKIRDIRLAEMRENRRNKILQQLLKDEEQQKKRKEELNEWVKKTKKESVTFITEENVDAAIEECLANVINHNRALDLEGNWYEGKYPPVEETQKSVAVGQQN